MILVNPCCCKKKVYVPCETYTLYIEVFGCVNPPIKPSFFAGLPISVYASPGGLLLASGVTDSTGHLTLTWPGIDPPPFWITAQSPWPDRSSSKAAWIFFGGKPPTLTQVIGGNNGFSDLLGGLCIVKHTGQRQWN